MRKIFARGVVGVVLALAASCILPMQTAVAATAAWAQAPGSPVGTLDTDGVYCIPGSSECIAVGSIYNQDQAFVESNATGVWQTAPSGTPTSATYTSSELDSISCTSTTFCVAVGSAVAASTGVGGPLVARFDGSSWSFQILSGSTIAADKLTSITCVNANDCLAVGTGDLLATFDGTTWSSTVLTNPAPYNTFTLSTISCSDAADCVAVGSYTGNSTRNAFAEVLSNGGWSPSAPSSVVGSDSFSGVSCTTSSCVAVGSEAGAGGDQTLIEEYANGSWSVDGQGVVGTLSGVSCPALGVCAAVGESGPYQPLVLTSAEGTWGVQAVSTPIATGELADVSCASVSACTVAGLGVACFCIVDADYGVLLSGSILAAPDTPTGLAATLAGANQVGLTWTAPTVNGGSPITGYDVFAGASPGAESTTPVNTSPITGTSYTVTGLAPGTDYFTVEALNAIGTSPPSNEVVAASSSTEVTSSASPSVTGQSVTFTATVAAVGYDAGTPTGTVTFNVDGTTQPALPLSSGTASLTIPNPAVGTHTVTAAYSGDPVYYGSTSPAFEQTVDQANTVTTLTSSANPSPVNQPGTITATVAALTPGSGTPTGTVTFSIDGTAQAPVTLSDTSASLNLATLPAGPHQITATYSGDDEFTADTSSPLTEDIAFSTDTLALVSTVNPSVAGQQVQITAAVAPVAPATGTPTGTVTFTVDGTAGSPVTLASGGATLTLPALSAGSHTITAAYSGDSTFAPATSAALTQTIGPAQTSTTLSSSANPSADGQTVTVTATVTATSPGAGTPSGTVLFTVDGVQQSPAATLTAGAASLTLPELSPGTHTITASYQGSTSYTASSSSALPQSVQPPAPTTTTLSTSPSGSAVEDTPVTLNATESPAASGAIQFYDGSTAFGSPVTVNASGTATLTTSALAIGSHTLTAIFTPTGAAYTASTSNSVVLQITTSGVGVDQTITREGNGTLTTPAFSTAGPRLLVAFISSDGPATKQTSTVTGAGLTWTLAQRANTKGGTAEVWTASSTASLSNVTVTSTPKTTGYDQQVTVEVFTGASGVGAGSTADKANGLPSLTVTTTQAGSWVFGVGEDYTRSAARTPGPGQSMLEQTLDTANGETFWVQDETSPTPAAGTTVTVNDTAPSGDTWNLAAVEILPSAG
ncbi:MAG TPA: Ig-like domain repeat protein [Actinospica sp.]|jgi:hypothetical protein|nr:Ig-like domain repeat protein [Actinospica sp.]